MMAKPITNTAKRKIRAVLICAFLDEVLGCLGDWLVGLGGTLAADITKTDKINGQL